MMTIIVDIVSKASMYVTQNSCSDETTTSKRIGWVGKQNGACVSHYHYHNRDPYSCCHINFLYKKPPSLLALVLQGLPLVR